MRWFWIETVTLRRGASLPSQPLPGPFTNGPYEWVAVRRCTERSSALGETRSENQSEDRQGDDDTCGEDAHFADFQWESPGVDFRSCPLGASLGAPLRLRTLVVAVEIAGDGCWADCQRAQFELRSSVSDWLFDADLRAVRIGRRHLVCVQFGVGFGFLVAFGGEIGDGCVE